MKATKELFDVFVKECKKWVDIFGLNDWYFHYVHKEDDGENEYDLLANCSWDFPSKQAVINLFEDWGDITEPNEESMKATAFHEVCHVLLARFQDLSYQPSPDEDEITSVGHAVINTLQNVLYPKYNKPDCIPGCECDHYKK